MFVGMFHLPRWLLILAVFLLATACSSLDNQGDSTTGIDESIAGGAERITLEANAEGTPATSGDQERAIISKWHGFASAVDGLQGYSRQMTINFEPERDNTDSQSWQIESIYQFSKAPLMEIHELNYQGTTQGMDTPALSLLASGSDHYLLVPDGGCLDITEEEFARMNSGILEPDYFLDEVDEIKRVGSKIVDGQPFDHYEFERHFLRKDSFREVVVGGDIYLPQAGSFPVRLILFVSGQGDFSGTGRIEEGTLTIDMDLDRLDTPTEISLPPPCSNANLYPLPTGSYDISVINDLLGYRVRLSIEEIVRFYQIEMEAAGYSLSEDPTVAEDMAYLTFTKSGREFIVQIEEGPESGEVSVLVSP